MTAALLGSDFDSGIVYPLRYHLIMFAFTWIINGNETTSYNLKMLHYL